MVALPAAVGILLSLVVGVLDSLTRAGTVPMRLLMQAFMWVDMPGLACVALTTVTVWCVAGRRTSRRSSAPVALAAAILTVPVVLARTAILHPGATDSITGIINLVGCVQLGLLLMSGMTLVVMGARALRTATDGDLTELRGQHG